jgi:hypothetical protein
VFDNEHSLHLWKRHPCTSTAERELMDWREQVTWRDLRGLLYSHRDIVCLLIQSNCIELQSSINILIWVAWHFYYLYYFCWCYHYYYYYYYYYYYFFFFYYYYYYSTIALFRVLSVGSSVLYKSVSEHYLWVTQAKITFHKLKQKKKTSDPVNVQLL